MRPTPAGHRPV